MTVVDLHPEDLFDKEARGGLSDDERVRLEAHVERCAACRAERVLRADFADELEGDDRDSAILGLVQGAIAGTKTREEAPPRAQVDESARRMPELDAIRGLRRRPRRNAIVILAAAAALLAASAAGAAGVTSRVWLRLRSDVQELTHASAPALSTAPSSPAHPLSRSPQPAVPAPAPVPVPAPALALSPARPASPSVSLSAPLSASPTTATALFDSANAARRSGDTATALDRYDALDRRFPATREAQVARATTGKLLLDRGDAAGALARFEAYLASGSSELREEAMAGRATALERLVRDDDEARAWAALLAAYPGTPYAAHARARVGRLQSR